MEITNISNGVVGLGNGRIIMPGETLELNPAWVDLDSVNILAEKGYLAVKNIGEEEPVRKAPTRQKRPRKKPANPAAKESETGE